MIVLKEVLGLNLIKSLSFMIFHLGLNSTFLLYFQKEFRSKCFIVDILKNL
jgi:hypothetical protein